MTHTRGQAHKYKYMYPTKWEKWGTVMNGDDRINPRQSDQVWTMCGRLRTSVNLLSAGKAKIGLVCSRQLLKNEPTSPLSSCPVGEASSWRWTLHAGEGKAPLIQSSHHFRSDDCSLDETVLSAHQRAASNARTGGQRTRLLILQHRSCELEAPPLVPLDVFADPARGNVEVMVRRKGSLQRR